MKEDKRVIKFRFWDAANKVMMDDHEGWIEGIGINYALSCSQDLGYITMQFTGLLDKQGKELFEGDIISKLGAFVLWDNELACWCFNFKTVDTPNVPLFYRDTISKMEVLGNIYEHHELLTPPTSKL